MCLLHLMFFLIAHNNTVDMVAEDVDTTTLNTIVVDVRHRVEMDGGVDDTSQAEADELEDHPALLDMVEAILTMSCPAEEDVDVDI